VVPTVLAPPLVLVSAFFADVAFLAPAFVFFCCSASLLAAAAAAEPRKAADMNVAGAAAVDCAARDDDDDDDDGRGRLLARCGRVLACCTAICRLRSAYTARASATL
jgi:hypothetical protein